MKVEERKHSSHRVTYFRAGVILKHKNEVLFVEQRENHNFGPPKGHRERGETPNMTAKRELFEETGIDISVERISSAPRLCIPIPKSHLTYVYYLITVSDEERQNWSITPRTNEIVGYKWVNNNIITSGLQTSDITGHVISVLSLVKF